MTPYTQSPPLTDRKAKNVKRNKNVSLLIDSPERPYKGVLIYGQAQQPRAINHGGHGAHGGKENFVNSAASVVYLADFAPS
jgi:hypothetical protein